MDLDDEELKVKIEKYGKEVLKEVAKLNFSNTSRILRTKII